MMFMAWGGDWLVKPPLTISGKCIADQATESLSAIHAQGVLHQDVELRNML